MNQADILQEYLVSLGFAVDQNTYSKFKNTIAEIEKAVQRQTGGMVKNYALAAIAIGTAITSVTLASAGMVNAFAASDMEYKKFALHMYMGEAAAKRMKMALDIMGESLDDIAWIPELREQFRGLIQLQKDLGDPEGWNDYMKSIRAIGFEWQRIQIILKYGLERVAVKLMRAFGYEVRDVADALKQIETWLMKMGWTDTVSDWLITIIGWFKRGTEAATWLWKTINEIWKSLTPNQKTLAAMGAFGLLFASSGPFGRAILVLTGLMAAYDDLQKSIKNPENSFLDWKKLKEYWDEFSKYWDETIIPKWDKYKPEIEKFFKGLGWEIDHFFDTAGRWDSIKYWADYIIGRIQQVAKQATIIISGLAEAVAEIFSDPLGSLYNGRPGAAIDRMNQALIANGFSPIMTGYGSGPTGTAGVREYEGQGTEEATKLEKIQQYITGKWGKAKDFFRGANDAINPKSQRLRDSEQQALSFFMAQDWTKEQAAGIVGNLSHESGMDPNILGDNGASFGLAQWQGERRNALFAYARKKGEDTPSFRTQLEFVQIELATSQSDAADALKKTSIIPESAQSFSSRFERPSDPQMGSRIDRAFSIFSDAQQNWNAAIQNAPAPSSSSVTANANSITSVGTVNINVSGAANGDAQETAQAVVKSWDDWRDRQRKEQQDRDRQLRARQLRELQPVVQ